MQPPSPTHAPHSPIPQGGPQGAPPPSVGHLAGVHGSGQQPPPFDGPHGAARTRPAPKARARRLGPQLSNRAWLLASGALFVSGATILIAAGALALGDTWRIDAAPRPEERSTAAAPTSVPAAGSVTATPATVLLSAAAAIPSHHLFWLQGPRRLVVDLMGARAALGAPVVAPPHPLVKKVRWAQHDDRVRFVIEVAPGARDEVETRLDGASLAITLHGGDA